MKGKSVFTYSEIETIKKFITEKLRATPDKQKGIRDKIRKIGFYFSDFSSKKDGYTIADLENLIHSNQVKVIEHSNDLKEKVFETMLVNKHIQFVKTEFLKPIKSDTVSILDTFKKNRFIPQMDNETKIPNSPGNYIMCLKKGASLPIVTIKPIFTIFEGLEVIYTGISRICLKSRDYKQHFKGNNAGRSTLRKSLGVLFGYDQIPRDKDPNTGKTKFNDSDEQTLTEWMWRNLVMFFLPTTDFDKFEIQLIEYFNPPLNLKNNYNNVNKEYRSLLSSMRRKK